MNESHLARLLASYFLFHYTDPTMTRDRIRIDEYGRLFVDGEPMDDTTRLRVGVLTCIILDCVGGDTDPDISNRLGDHVAYRDATLWVAKLLRKGAFIHVLGEFLHRRGEVA